MLKFEHITAGTKIRAYDFQPMPGRTDRYVEGTVVRHCNDLAHMPGVMFLVIMADTDTAFTGEHTRVGEEVFVPMEMTFDFDERVQEVA